MLETRLSKAALLVLLLSSITIAHEECPVDMDLDRFMAAFIQYKQDNMVSQMDEFLSLLLKFQSVSSSAECCLKGGTLETGIDTGLDTGLAPQPIGIQIGSTDCRKYTKISEEEYTGTQSRTFTNKTCQRWDSQSPHRHTHTNTKEYDGNIRNVSQAENYCRNPDQKVRGPWCFTTDPNKRWEYCDVEFCNGCRHTRTGLEYIGSKNFAYGNLCLRWDDTTHHKFTPANFSGRIDNLSQAENYCRNPDHSRGGPWCYVNTPEGVEQKQCALPYCNGCQYHEYYDGTKNTTESGLTCQRWDTQSPHPHSMTDPRKFQFSVRLTITHMNTAENYCRIVSGYNRIRPWCFTTANATEWDYCDVPLC